MTEELSLERRLLRWSQELAGIGRTGISFTRDAYDKERYEEVIRIAAEIAASVNESFSVDVEVAREIAKGWREEVAAGFPGYACPKVSVGAIVFNSANELLLVRSTASKIWCFPVGMADLGLPPSEVARKEVREEAGLVVRPTRLLGVGDSLVRGFNRQLHVYSLLLYCELVSGTPRPQTVEIDQAGFFARRVLPEPLDNDGVWVDEAFAAHFERAREAYFD